MKHLMKMCMRRALVVAVVGAGVSLAGASDLPGQLSASDGMLAQVMALHGLDERGALVPNANLVRFVNRGGTAVREPAL